ncbi:photosystem II core complex proteins psbY, chloroplastic-like [Melia azedarach]|uniref:Photosystem II core complex proteins psbY, chloroplastic-like n=1 Tax=Melia azedarach TaxID=155640 RepID=A0ACC1XP60_MELAZ|nr:photosystem II core complex proteins psbY, chloroplastic-like [Melia azedarach]
MAGTLATMYMLNPKILIINTPKNLSKCKPTTEPTPFLSFQNLNRSVTISKSSSDSSISSSLTGTAMAGTIFATLAASYPAMAAQQLAETAERLGLGGVAASSFFTVPSASANGIATTAGASSDTRGLLLLAIVTSCYCLGPLQHSSTWFKSD